ncbi:intracellular hyaluronan-binding protein 4 [Leptodactylus fuscus]
MQEAFGCVVKNRFFQLLDDESDPLDFLHQTSVELNRSKKKEETAAKKAGSQRSNKKESQKDRKTIVANTEAPGLKRAPKQSMQKLTEDENSSTEMNVERSERRTAFREFRPNFIDKSKEYRVDNVDKEAQVRSWIANQRGGMRTRGRGGSPRNMDYENQRGKREFERHSGSDKARIRAEDKRGGGGPHNWGAIKDFSEVALTPLENVEVTETVDVVEEQQDAHCRELAFVPKKKEAPPRPILDLKWVLRVRPCMQIPTESLQSVVASLKMGKFSSLDIRNAYLHILNAGLCPLGIYPGDGVSLMAILRSRVVTVIPFLDDVLNLDMLLDMHHRMILLPEAKILRSDAPTSEEFSLFSSVLHSCWSSLGRVTSGFCFPGLEYEEIEDLTREMSLDEWKSMQDQSRPKIEFNLRKPESSVPSKAIVIHRSKFANNSMENEDSHYGFRKPVNDITSQLDINFGSLPRPGRGGRGGGRGNPRREDGFRHVVHNVHEFYLNPDDPEDFPALT